MPAVSRAEHADIDALAAVITAALFDHPLSLFLVPDRGDRHRIYPQLARLVFLEPALSAGIVWCTADRTGVAAWVRINPARSTDPDPHTVAQLRQLTGRWYPRLARLLEEQAADPVVPHDRLAMLAVHPDHQRHGLGAALLTAHHTHLDVVSRPAYLDAASPDLVAYYERFGYHELGQLVRLSQQAVLRAMWRPPNGAPVRS
jgi:ribosomal protein S18 acetylase RimI-like enzyme